MSSPAYRMGVNQAETPGINSEPTGYQKIRRNQRVRKAIKANLDK